MWERHKTTTGDYRLKFTFLLSVQRYSLPLPPTTKYPSSYINAVQVEVSQVFDKSILLFLLHMNDYCNVYPPF